MPDTVVETKKILATLKDGDTVEVTVDNFVAVQNFSNMAALKNFPVSSEKIDEHNYLVTLTAAGASAENTEALPEEQACSGDSRAKKDGCGDLFR